MRAGGRVTRIALNSGDFHALLNQSGKHISFRIDADGPATRTGGKDFWIKTNPQDAVASCDKAALGVGTGQNAVSIGENKRATASSAGVAQLAQMLDRPAMPGPADGSQLCDRTAQRSWIAKDGSTLTGWRLQRRPGSTTCACRNAASPPPALPCGGWIAATITGGLPQA